MSEHESPAGIPQGPDAGAVAALIQELRHPTLAEEKRGGYSREHVDSLFGRAAEMLGHLNGAVVRLSGELLHSDVEQKASEEATEMLLAAQRVVQSIKAKGQSDADKLVEAARKEKEEAERLREEIAGAAEAARLEAEKIVVEARAEAERLDAAAHTSIASARAQAASLIDAGRVEQERLISSATEELHSATTQLHEDRARLESEISSLRADWKSRLHETLARLETLGSGSGSGAGDEAEAHADAESEAATARRS